MSNRTLAIIKPDSVRKNNTGKIIDRILSASFEIAAMEQQHFSRERAEGFYDIHRERPFFNDLISFMASGPCVAMALKKNSAVSSFRELIGETDPEKADEGTIRREFAENVQSNAVHGSDSDENAAKEIAFFFPSLEISTD
ncbi:MAG: nucleoside-diphosphate kinase [Candidatus Neomarinimicrobiota bacterium]|nr:nucleoside-diphosphate kinase [Candidatus Neomarinimicrobiota bacterium]